MTNAKEDALTQAKKCIQAMASARPPTKIQLGLALRGLLYHLEREEQDRLKRKEEVMKAVGIQRLDDAARAVARAEWEGDMLMVEIAQRELWKAVCAVVFSVRIESK